METNNTTSYDIELKLFERYKEMRNIIPVFNHYPTYDFLENEEIFKQGFIAGAKIMASLYVDA